MERARGGGAGAGLARGAGAAGAATDLAGVRRNKQPASRTQERAARSPLVFMDHPAMGRQIRNVVPFPGSLVKSIVPSWICTIRKVMARPIPEPSFLVLKYSRKILSRTSAGMPVPVSEMRSSDTGTGI